MSDKEYEIELEIEHLKEQGFVSNFTKSEKQALEAAIYETGMAATIKPGVVNLICDPNSDAVSLWKTSDAKIPSHFWEAFERAKRITNLSLDF